MDYEESHSSRLGGLMVQLRAGDLSADNLQALREASFRCIVTTGFPPFLFPMPDDSSTVRAVIRLLRTPDDVDAIFDVGKAAYSEMEQSSDETNRARLREAITWANDLLRDTRRSRRIQPDSFAE